MKKYTYFYGSLVNDGKYFAGLYDSKAAAESDRQRTFKEGRNATRVVTISIPKFAKRKGTPR